ncbi:MAG: PTS sugar transporter subunit IIA [Gammaproteobacteria bacterium]|nr:PTS sugar transporter subunit IIA [Gammaproteobacteria bacterium]
MNLKDLVSPDSVVCNADTVSKKRALELLADLLARQAGTNESLEIFQLLTEREKLGSTSLGHGIALPHARTNLCDHAIGVFIRTKNGIDFDSPDHQPTDLLFALMVPEHYTDEHLNILAELASMFNDENFCQNLRSANNDKELHQRLTSWNITSQAS